MQLTNSYIAHSCAIPVIKIATLVVFECFSFYFHCDKVISSLFSCHAIYSKFIRRLSTTNTDDSHGHLKWTADREWWKWFTAFWLSGVAQPQVLSVPAPMNPFILRSSIWFSSILWSSKSTSIGLLRSVKTIDAEPEQFSGLHCKIQTVATTAADAAEVINIMMSNRMNPWCQ